MKKLLKINASSRQEVSVSRQLANELASGLQSVFPELEVQDRDLSHSELPHVTENMINAFYTPEQDRTEAQKQDTVISDQYVKELQEADTLVIGLPIYNFGVPSALKAWFDLIARVGVTFKYDESGPVGLVGDKETYIVITSGGTGIGSEYDFATNHLRTFLGFLGITNVTVIEADMLMFTDNAKLGSAKEHIQKIIDEKKGVAVS